MTQRRRRRRRSHDAAALLAVLVGLETRLRPVVVEVGELLRVDRSVSLPETDRGARAAEARARALRGGH